MQIPAVQENLLREIADLLKGVDPKTVFSSWRKLFGFTIGWAKPTPEILSLLNTHDPGFAFEDCEIVLIHNREQGDCHLHEVGEGNFLILGEKNGFEKPKGGIFVADSKEGQNEYELDDKPLHEGDLLHVPAKQIHVFYGTVDVLGIIYPRIRQGEEEFDAIDFIYTNESKRHVVKKINTDPKPRA